MKQCPRCHDDYADDLNFCLKDGTPLVTVQDNDKTWVLPEPIPTIAAQGRQIEPGPTVASPTPQRSSTWKVLTVAGVILAICAYGALKIALRWQEREELAAQNNNSAPIAFNFGASATPTVDISLTPSPSPSTSPIVAMVSPTPAESPQPRLLPGTYQMQLKLNNSPEDAFGLRTMKMQFIFNADGTYTIQGFITIAGTGVEDRLYREERGSYSVSDDLLMFSERLARQLDRENNVWKPWGTPEDGRWAHEKIRNITATSFELYSDGKWVKVWKL